MSSTTETISASAAAERVLNFAALLDDRDRSSPCYDAFRGSEAIVHTPLQRLAVPELPGVRLWVKDERRQRGLVPGANSFKSRGALAAALETREQNSSVDTLVTASAGNHAESVVWAARRLGIWNVVIFAPRTISEVKEKVLRGGGARIRDALNINVQQNPSTGVVLDKVADTLETASERAATFMGLASPDRTAFIPPFDSEFVMAGQSTMLPEIAIDLEKQGASGHEERKFVIPVPFGGGGLAGGMAAALHKMRAEGRMLGTTLRGVQMEGCNAAAFALQGEALERLPDPSCDGTAVLRPGELTMAIARDPSYVESIASVPKRYVGMAMKILERELGHTVEPAGALSLAHVLHLYYRRHASVEENTEFVVLVTGGRRTQQTADQFAAAASSGIAPGSKSARRTPPRSMTNTPASDPSGQEEGRRVWHRAQVWSSPVAR